ncbi:MAG: DUF2934 domain-containing protein [Candidatus Omnitrophica bacterium]|nr:DUF2934 domain-containing protein [Candidatus Omnitrophota bacterium]
MGFVRNSKSTSSKSSACCDNAKLAQMIRDRAYYLWESKGKPKGQDLTIWLQAEKEIRSKCK